MNVQYALSKSDFERLVSIENLIMFQIESIEESINDSTSFIDSFNNLEDLKKYIANQNNEILRSTIILRKNHKKLKTVIAL